MSVAFVTGGKFLPRTARAVAGGGGAPAMPQEEVKPKITIKNVEYKKKGRDDVPIIIIKEVT